MELSREIEFTPAFDKRHPDPSKNYGIHGASMRWCLKGEHGAIQFVVFTDWHLPHVTEELKAKGSFQEPMAADIGYHSHVPRYEGQTLLEQDCDVIGGPCYYDGSGLQAEEGLRLLITEGSEAVWRWMEEYYDVWLRQEKAA